MSEQKKYSKSFQLYKARRTGDGAASEWDLGSKKDENGDIIHPCVFLGMANQSGKDDNENASFDWKNKIVFKLGVADIGEILAVLVGLQDGVGPRNSETGKHKGLFHSNPTGNAMLFFGKGEQGGFRIHLRVKKGEEKIAVEHRITEGEACVLSTLLRRAIEVMYRWC
jgi:hypothetical protein